MSDIVIYSVIAALTSLVVALAACMRRSRCTEIDTPCFKLKRDVIDAKDAD